jgi:hypothetical protein
LQTILYYRDYAALARRLMENGDRRGMHEVLEVLALGFDEIADALDAGEVVMLRDQREAAKAGTYSWHRGVRNGH